MGKDALLWISQLSRKQVTSTERAILTAYANLAGRHGECFASNETIARAVDTERQYVVRCKKRLLAKGLLVQAKTPRFKTETKWYVLPVGCAELGLSPAVLKNSLEDANLSTSARGRVSSLIRIKKDKTKGRAISPAKRPVRLHKSEPLPSEKENGIRTKNNSEAATPRFTTSVAVTATERVCAVSEEKREHLAPPPRRVDVRAIMDAWFCVFWQAFPRKQRKAETYALFMRLKPSHHLVGMMLAAIDAAKSSGEWDDQQYIPLPTKWLSDRRWLDDYAPPKKVRRLVL